MLDASQAEITVARGLVNAGGDVAVLRSLAGPFRHHILRLAPALFRFINDALDQTIMKTAVGVWQLGFGTPALEIFVAPGHAAKVVCEIVDSKPFIPKSLKRLVIGCKTEEAVITCGGLLW